MQAVRDALSGGGRLSAPTRAKILQAAAELGYRPNPLARALKTGRTNLLGFWYFPILSPHIIEVVSHIERHLRYSPYKLLLTNARMFLEKNSSEEFLPADWPVDGAFAFELGAVPDMIMKAKGQVAPPVVYLGHNHQPLMPSEPVDAVVVDFSSAVEEAVRHLLATRQRVAMLCMEPLAQSGDVRSATYAKLTREAGREPEYIFPPFAHPIRELAKRRLIRLLS